MDEEAGQPRKAPATGGQGVAAGSRAHGVEVWLREHPTALVCAFTEEGRIAPVPAELSLLASHRIDERSTLDLVAPGDATKVVKAFIVARDHGVAVTRVRLGADPDLALDLHYVDVREDYGVVLRLALLADSADEERSVDPDSLTPARPRLATIHKSAVATICSVDDSATRMLGWTADELVGRQTLELIHPDDQSRAIDNWMEFVRVGAEHTVRLRYRCKDGSWLWLETSNHFRDPRDPEQGVDCQLVDISDEMAAHDALRHSEQFLRRITETVPVGIAELAPDRTIVYCNGRLRQMLASRASVTLPGLIDSLDAGGAFRLEKAIGSVLDGGRDHDIEARLVGSGEQPDRLCQINLRAVTDGDRVLGAVLCVVDITELKLRAATDPLTGVNNRSAIFDALYTSLAGPGPTVVVFIDLDRFKAVNDRFGHEVGDRVLGQIAGALREAVRGADVIGRIGGDEFLVVCPEVSSPAVGLALADRLRLTVQVCAVQSELDLGASIGVAWIPPGSATADEAIARADAAMYAAKRSGTGEPVLWDPVLTGAVVTAELTGRP